MCLHGGGGPGTSGSFAGHVGPLIFGDKGFAQGGLLRYSREMQLVSRSGIIRALSFDFLHNPATSIVGRLELSPPLADIFGLGGFYLEMN